MNGNSKLFAKPFRNWIKQGGKAGGALSAAITFALASFAPQAIAESIARAQYEMPTQRYGHFALGQPHEYARLAVVTNTGRRLVFELPEDEVFEDLTPRLVRLAANEPVELLTIVSQRQTGARLVLIRLNGDRLESSAESPAVGTPMRWLNPVGVVDLDGDGRAELASVTTPHLGGTLRVYRREGARLVEIAAMGGFSNHVYGSPELGLAAYQTVAERVRLLVPDNSRTQLRVIDFNSGRLAEVGRCALPAPVTGAIKPLVGSEVSLGLATGKHVVVSNDCELSRKPS